MSADIERARTIMGVDPSVFRRAEGADFLTKEHIKYPVQHFVGVLLIDGFCICAQCSRV